MLSSAIKILVFILGPELLGANPYPDPSAVPADDAAKMHLAPTEMTPVKAGAGGTPVLRVRIDYDRATKRYQLGDLIRENSGTNALALHARSEDPHGSFRAELLDPTTRQRIYAASQGTGYYFRELSRGLSFRFPLPKRALLLRVTAEDDQAGTQKVIIEELVNPSAAHSYAAPETADVRVLQTSEHERPLVVNAYAEGYTVARKNQFWLDAAKMLAALRASDFPGIARFQINAVWAPSKLAMGSAQNLGANVPERDSFLGLYFPYWTGFGRWYHIVYPTRIERFRRALAVHPYDYPIALVDSSDYWGVGNFGELTAVPARNSSFSYLLLHEFGHYFGLNEEYESGGATELAFAPRMPEPWSQNITFQSQRQNIKWKDMISPATPVPTSAGFGSARTIGLFTGGYAETPRPSAVYKPAKQCTMSSGGGFCNVCLAALEERIKIDAGDFAPTEPDEESAGEDASENACNCRLDTAKNLCTLYKGEEALAWTPLSASRTCDQSFCTKQFAFHHKLHCR